MKKIWFLIAVSTVLLSACQMPFSSSGNDSVPFIQNNVHLIAASDQIDQKIIAQLQTAKQKKVPFQNLMMEVRMSEDMQQNLYDQLEKDSSVEDTNQAKTIYLTIVEDRMDSYRTLLNTLDKQDYGALSLGVSEHQVNDQNSMQTSLAAINSILTNAKQKKINTL